MLSRYLFGVGMLSRYHLGLDLLRYHCVMDICLHSRYQLVLDTLVGYHYGVEMLSINQGGLGMSNKLCLAKDLLHIGFC